MLVFIFKRCHSPYSTPPWRAKQHTCPPPATLGHTRNTHHSKMRDSCAVSCTKLRGEKLGLSFYVFPSDKDNSERRNLWSSAIKRNSIPKESKPWQSSNYTRICSKHLLLLNTLVTVTYIGSHLCF